MFILVRAVFKNRISLQVEAMHPECALVEQHMKAEEDCNQILQLENNHSAKAGQCVLSSLWWEQRDLGKCFYVRTHFHLFSFGTKEIGSFQS